MQKRTTGLLILTLTALGLACAYYNTLFNAKRLYEKAERIRVESDQADLPKSAGKLYKDVVKKTAKVLKFYPQHSCVDEALLVMGMAFYRQGEYEKALRKFKELTVQYPRSSFVAEGLLGMGLIYYAQDNPTKAEEIFKKLLASDDIINVRKVKDDALFMLAEMARNRTGDYRSAIEIFQSVIDTYKKSDLKQTAQFNIAESFYVLQDYENAYAEFEKASRYRDIKVLAYKAQYRMGECRMQTGEYEKALALYGRMLKNEKLEKYYPEI